MKSVKGQILTLLFVLASTSFSLDIQGEYHLQQTIHMYDLSSHPVGYKIVGKFSALRKGPDVYLLELDDLKLHIMSRRAPTPLGFIEHSSNLETLSTKPFLIEMNKGIVQAIHIDRSESMDIKNLKRSLASILQFKVDGSSGEELDSSGLCQVVYKKSNNKVTKQKTDCLPAATIGQSSHLWGSVLHSIRTVEATLSDSGDQLMSSTSSESHSLQANIVEYASTKVAASLTLTRTENLPDSSMIYSGSTEDVVANTLIEIGGSYEKYNLTLEKKESLCPNGPCPKLKTVISENAKFLADIGTTRSAGAFLRIAEAFSTSPQDEISLVLKRKDFKDILPLLMDVAGSVQSDETHQAVLKRLRMNSEKYDLDLCERYLWALSLSPQPSPAITKEVVHLVKQKHKDLKLFQTILLTATGMVKKITEASKGDHNDLLKELVDILKEELEECEASDEDCRQQYLKALVQLESPLLKQTFITYTLNSTKKSGVTALLGLVRLGRSNWDRDVLSVAQQVLFAGKGFDSSARVLALEILLQSRPSEHQLKSLLQLLYRNETELGQLLLQKLDLISAKCENFKQLVDVSMEDIRKSWWIMSQGGLSTSFARSFMTNGFLSTEQEISSGILKRGRVHVNLQLGNKTYSVFTLGLFTSGMASLVSGDNSGEDEGSSAGMELEVLGQSLRPFTLFNGQGELMSHVWHGTASTRTPAYQANVRMSRERSHIPLGCGGAVLEVGLDWAASLELSGQIQISLWNKNAQAAVYNRAGLGMKSRMIVSTEFVQTMVDSSLSAQPSLDLTSDLDFSSSISLCLMLQQPDTHIRYNTYKIERILGSKHRLRKTMYTTIHIPGRTYSLNKKNNEMCSGIHS